MIRRLKFVVPIAIILVLVGLNIRVATAHRWGGYHWNRGGLTVPIRTWNYAARWQLAENARADIQSKVRATGINLVNDNVNFHSDISVFDGNFGNTGWGGLASLESVSWSWSHFGWVHINHGHARYNSYYGGSPEWIQGVQCQEIYHLYGFDHDNSGGCMGLGYFAGQNHFLSTHSAQDFYNLYRTHGH